VIQLYTPMMLIMIHVATKTDSTYKYDVQNFVFQKSYFCVSIVIHISMHSVTSFIITRLLLCAIYLKVVNTYV